MKKQLISNKNDNLKEKTKKVNEVGITLKEYINELIYDNLIRKFGIKNEDRNKSKK